MKWVNIHIFGEKFRFPFTEGAQGGCRGWAPRVLKLSRTPGPLVGFVKPGHAGPNSGECAPVDLRRTSGRQVAATSGGQGFHSGASPPTRTGLAARRPGRTFHFQAGSDPWRRRKGQPRRRNSCRALFSRQRWVGAGMGMGVEERSRHYLEDLGGRMDSQSSPDLGFCWGDGI